MSGRPVYVEVPRPDGSSERVRVGVAIEQGDGFVLRLGELTLGAPEKASTGWARPAAAAAPAAGGDTSGGVFPNYGRSKGGAIRGATRGDLEYYANGARRSLNDPAKARWHDKERQLLAQIEAELARQGAEDPGGEGGYSQDSYGGGYGGGGYGGGGYGGGGGGGGGGGYGGDEPPPPSDDDAPF